MVVSTAIAVALCLCASKARMVADGQCRVFPVNYYVINIDGSLIVSADTVCLLPIQSHH